MTGFSDFPDQPLCMIAYDAPNGSLVTAQVVRVGNGKNAYRAQTFVNGTRMATSHYDTREEATSEADAMARCYAFEVHHA